MGVRGLLRLLIRLAKLGICALLLIAAAFVAIYQHLPTAEQLGHMIHHPQVELGISETGAITSAMCRGCGIYLRPEDIPRHVKDAVIAVEDRRFHSHHGVDFRAIARAALANISSFGIAQGGSTITQQLAKAIMLSADRTIGRKILESVLAIKLERHFTKDEILAAYLNHAYFGDSVYSIEQAARYYFAKRARSLNLYEAALLAGMLKAPNGYNAKGRPAKAKRRARLVLELMVEQNMATEQEAEQARRIGVKRGEEIYRALRARYFLEWVKQQAKDHIPTSSYGQSVFLISTLQPNVQFYGRVTSGRLLQRTRTRGADQVALVAMDLQGAVRAMIGGASFAESQFNRATQAKRQPASAFKPLVYLAALEAGMRRDSKILDRPITINNWTPKNFDSRYLGEITLADGLALSRNAATVRLAQEVGTAAIVDLARRLGMSSRFHNAQSLALGTAETTLLELTSVYAVFARGGKSVTPFGVYGIRNSEGRMLYWRPAPEVRQVVKARHIKDLNWMLRQTVTRGTGRKAAFSYPAVGKTGTSQDSRDAWFLGFSGSLVAGLWVGNDSGTPTKGLRGGGMPAEAWRNFMANSHIDRSPVAIVGLGKPRLLLAKR